MLVKLTESHSVTFSVAVGSRDPWLLCPVLWLSWGWTWLHKATLGAGPIPTLRWWRRTVSPHTPAPNHGHRGEEAPRGHAGWRLTTLTQLTGVGLGCSRGAGARVSCPLLPTANLLSCEVLHNHSGTARSAFPTFISPCKSWVHVGCSNLDPTHVWVKESGLKSDDRCF